MTTDFYALDDSQVAATLADNGVPAWVGRWRRTSLDRFVDLGGVPTTRNEEYKYTSLKTVQRTAWTPVLAPRGSADVRDQLEERGLLTPSPARLVFVDGHYDANLSTLATLPDGVVVRSLAATLSDWPADLADRLARPADDEGYPFAAVNAAFVRDGAYIHVPRRVRVEQPVELLFVTTAGPDPIATHTRNVVVAEESAELALLETFVGLGEGAYLTNTVLELGVGENAHVDHTRIQREAKEATHISLIRSRQERSSNFFTHGFSFGGGLVRNDVQAILGGEGVECTLNGLYLGRGGQHIDNHTTIDHREPHCNSYELYKGVLDERATAVFNGKIFVRQKAQKTNALQSNKNLLLSSDATINTKPQLEIWADDVRCTHGATIGQLDDEALFYLRTRGLPRDVARSVLTYAFANEVIGEVRHEALRDQLEHELAEWLPRTAELEAAR